MPFHQAPGGAQSACGPSYGPPDSLRATAAAEVTAMLAILLSYIWLWQRTFPGNPLVVVALYFALGYASHRRRGESAPEIGLRIDNWRPAARDAAGVVAFGVGAPLAWGAAHGTWHFEPAASSLVSLAAHIPWGAAQQYGLLCFFYRRLREVFDSPLAATVAASAIFAACHAPNVFLIGVTFAAGLISCTLYRREPNVFVLGVAHGLISFTLFYALPYSLTHNLIVGPGYFSTPG